MSRLRTVALGVALLAGAVLGLAVVSTIGLVVTGTAKLYAIPGSGMESTLHCATPAVGCEAGTKDRVVALTRFVSYDRGDVVVFDATAKAAEKCGDAAKVIKRIVGLPGERLELRPVDGREHVYVDGERLAEPYVEDERRPVGLPRKTFAISADAYFVAGDNRAQSCDSREWGVLPEDNLTGKVVMTYWPPGRISIR